MKVSKSKPNFVLDCAATTSRMHEYNGLKDYNLASFFSSKRRRKLLLKQGLITKSGLIVERSNSKQHSNLGNTKPNMNLNSVASEGNLKSSALFKSTSPVVSKSKKKKFEKKEVKPLSQEELKELFKKYKKPGSISTDDLNTQSLNNENTQKNTQKTEETYSETKVENHDRKPTIKESETSIINREGTTSGIEVAADIDIIEENPPNL